MNDYSLVLTNKGNLSTFQAADVLSEVLNYSEDDALALINHLPAEAAMGLTASQAETLENVFRSRGLGVCVTDGQTARSGSLNTAGAVAAGSLGTLAGLSILSRIANRRRRYFYSPPAPPMRFGGPGHFGMMGPGPGGRR